MSATNVVRVVSHHLPPIVWSCPRCRCSIFDCSERFRANSNGKLLDIWLVYRCRSCDATKNLTVVERRPVSKVPRALLDAAQRNDAAVARALARDTALVRRNGTSFAGGDDWAIDGAAALPLVLDFAESMLVRLDRIVAAALELPRSRLPVAVDGRLRLWSGAVDALRGGA